MNLEHRNQEVLSKCILETPYLGLANRCPVCTGDKGYAIDQNFFCMYREEVTKRKKNNYIQKILQLS